MTAGNRIFVTGKFVSSTEVIIGELCHFFMILVVKTAPKEIAEITTISQMTLKVRKLQKEWYFVTKIVLTYCEKKLY